MRYEQMSITHYLQIPLLLYPLIYLLSCEQGSCLISPIRILILGFQSTGHKVHTRRRLLLGRVGNPSPLRPRTAVIRIQLDLGAGRAGRIVVAVRSAGPVRHRRPLTPQHAGSRDERRRRPQRLPEGLRRVAVGEGVGDDVSGMRGEVGGADQAAEAVVRRADVGGGRQVGSLQGRGRVGVDVVGVGADLDVFGLDDAVAIQARDPLRLREAGGGVRREGAAGGRGALAPSTRPTPQAGFAGRRATGVAVRLEFDARVATHAGVGEGHELVEDGELELELDAVDHWLQRRLDLVAVVVLHGQQDEVHGDDDDVDPDQLRHHLPGLAVVDGSQQLDGGVDVDGGDGELLDAESGHLQLLEDVEGAGEGVGVVGVGAVGQDGGGDVEADGVDDDHGQHEPEGPLLTHHQVQAWVQHDGLSGHHGIPADGDDGDREIRIRRDGEEFEHEAQSVQDASVRGDQQGPEVKASMAFEGQEDLDVELEDVVPGDGGERGNGHVDARRR